MRESAPVLVDSRSDEALQRDGFVVVPLLSRAEAGALRDLFLEISDARPNSFRSDMEVEDRDYRKRAKHAIADALDGPAIGLFRNHTPFIHHFLAKFPGDESGFHLHQDWMFVDEQAGRRTYVVWLALQDIEGHNGQLRVLRGSHRLERSLRGTGLTAPWLDGASSLEDRLRSVPIAAGECVVFDNSLAHASFPNYTDDPRIVAAVAVREVGDQLIHYRLESDSEVGIYEFDEEALRFVTPQALADGSAGLRRLGSTSLRPSELSERAVRRWFDRQPTNVPGLLVRRFRSTRDSVATGAGSMSSSLRSTLGYATESIGRTRARGRDRIGPSVADGRNALAERRGMLAELPTRAAMAVLGTNEAIIDRFGPRTPAIWDPTAFEWAQRIEAGFPQIRAEVEALIAGPSEIPHIEDVTGGIPQGNVGPWRTFVMMHQGRWMDWNCRRCPQTTDLVRTIPGLMMAGFSVLEPGTHITEHRGPNKGALRYQLGVIVPGERGDCRIRVGDEMIHWADGEGVMFDFTVPHEAWNDTEETRVLLMLEVLTPLPWYLTPTNRLAQNAMRWFPTTRDMTARLKVLEPQLQRAT